MLHNYFYQRLHLKSPLGSRNFLGKAQLPRREAVTQGRSGFRKVEMLSKKISLTPFHERYPGRQSLPFLKNLQKPCDFPTHLFALGILPAMPALEVTPSRQHATRRRCAALVCLLDGGACGGGESLVRSVFRGLDRWVYFTEVRWFPEGNGTCLS